MIVVWNTGLILEVVALLMLFLLSTYFLFQNAENLRRRFLYLLLAFLGLLLFILKPVLIVHEDKSNKTLQNDSEILDFLASDELLTIDTIILTGNIYREKVLDQLQDFHLIHAPDSIPMGFSSIFLPSITENEDWTLKGMTNLPVGSEIKLKQADGLVIDGEVLEGGRFEIISKAPSVGLYQYELMAITEIDTISEILPIEVKAESKLKMLIMAESPSFELNYFKNYWSNLGHGLIQRIKIAKDKYNTTFINAPRRSISRLNEDLLEELDLLLFDLSSWNGLSGNVRNIVREQSRNNALAVIIRMNEVDERLLNLPSIRAINFYDDIFGETEITKIELQKNSSWKDFQGHALLEDGYGKFLVLGLNNTYKLILNDERSTYQNFWAALISELYLEKEESFEVEVEFPVLAGQKKDVNLLNLEQGSKVQLNGEEALELLHVPLIENLAKCELTPGPAWNKINIEGGEVGCYFYAFQENAWTLIQSEKTSNYIVGINGKSTSLIASTYETRRELPWWLSFAIALLGFGLLWLDEKVNT